MCLGSVFKVWCDRGIPVEKGSNPKGKALVEPLPSLARGDLGRHHFPEAKVSKGFKPLAWLSYTKGNQRLEGGIPKANRLPSNFGGAYC